MKLLYLLAASAAMALLSVPCAAQQVAAGGGPRNNLQANLGSSRIADMPPACRNGCFSWERGHGFRGGFGGVFVVEREVPVIVEREVVREVPAAAPPAPAPPRKPYVIGNSYASLPGGCMKMIEGGVSYYFCGGGEWYRQTGSGRSARYQAVVRKL